MALIHSVKRCSVIGMVVYCAVTVFQCFTLHFCGKKEVSTRTCSGDPQKFFLGDPTQLGKEGRLNKNCK